MDQPLRRSPDVLTTLGLVAGLGAVFAASCCVLPLVIASLGAGAGVFAVLELLADYRTPLLILAAALVAGAWLLYLWRGRDLRRGRARYTTAALSVATVLVITAASWNVIESPLLKIVRAAH
jgi:mercuric ion transport protein